MPGNPGIAQERKNCFIFNGGHLPIAQERNNPFLSSLRYHNGCMTLNSNLDRNEKSSNFTTVGIPTVVNEA